MELYNLIAAWVGWPVVVAVMLAGGLYAGWALNNRIESLKETNEKLSKELTAYKQSESSFVLPREAYGIQVSYPTMNQQVSQSFEVKGTFRELPEGFEIWTSTFWGQGRENKYWPQEPASILGNTWSSQVNFVDPGRRPILVFVVGKYGKALMHYFKKAG